MAERNNNEGDGGVNQREPSSLDYLDDRDRGGGGGEEAPTAATKQRPPQGSNFNFNAPVPNPNVFPRYTVHTYHDYSTFIKEGGVIKKHKKSNRNFPARLHAILSNDQYSHIISWMVSNPINIKFQHDTDIISLISIYTIHQQCYVSDVILITASFSVFSSCSATWSCLEGPQKGPTGSRRPSKIFRSITLHVFYQTAEWMGFQKAPPDGCR